MSVGARKVGCIQPHNFPDMSGLVVGERPRNLMQKSAGGGLNDHPDDVSEKCASSWKKGLGEVGAGCMIGCVHKEMAYLKGATTLKPS